MEKTLRNFLAACQDDPLLRDFAQKHPLSLHFVLTDKELEFSLYFREGAVQSEWGPAVEKTDLTARLNAETFDQVMSGSLDGSNAYMRGKLRVSGDLMKGMAFQRITRDLIRLYTEAKKEG